MARKKDPNAVALGRKRRGNFSKDHERTALENLAKARAVRWKKKVDSHEAVR